MKWHKYTIHTIDTAEEAVLSMLEDLGIVSVEIEDAVPVPASESGNLFGDVVPEFPEDDHRAGISFYIEEQEEKSAQLPGEDGIYEADRQLLGQVKEGLASLRSFLEIGEGRVTSGETEDKDWINKWKEYFHAFTVEGIRIIPSWEEDTDTADASMVLHIDPGTAFGTGKHETTQLAIRGLRKYLHKGDHVLDIGTGSGILGIVALKSGAEMVYGTDIDPVAFPALSDNLAKNAVDPASFTCALADVITEEEARKAVKAASPGGYEVVTANIIAEILAELIPFVPDFLAPGGICITSGILKEKREVVEKAAAKAGLYVRAVESLGDWCSVILEKR